MSSQRKIIVDYHVVSDSSIPLVENRVNDLIAKGWQPWGQINVYIHPSGGSRFVQPMVKYEEPSDQVMAHVGIAGDLYTSKMESGGVDSITITSYSKA